MQTPGRLQAEGSSPRCGERTYQTKTVFGQSDELLVSRGTDIQPNGQQSLQGRHDQWGLHGVAVSFPLHFLPLLIRHGRLRDRGRVACCSAFLPDLWTFSNLIMDLFSSFSAGPCFWKSSWEYFSYFLFQGFADFQPYSQIPESVQFTGVHCYTILEGKCTWQFLRSTWIYENSMVITDSICFIISNDQERKK